MGGHGFQHLGGGDHRFTEHIGLAHDKFLHYCHVFDGDFHPQITACDHDAVGCFQNLIQMIAGPDAFDFSDNERLVPKAGGRFSNRIDVGSGFDKGLTDSIHAVSHGKFETLVIVFRKGTDPQIDARQVQPLAGTQPAAHHHFTVYVVSVDSIHFHFYVAIIYK